MQNPSNWFQASKLQVFQPQIPCSISPIILKPIPPLLESSFFSQAILKEIGFLTSEQNKQATSNSIFQNIFLCGECGCKALSRETLSEINNQLNIEKENQQHLKDRQKKGKFSKIWNQIHKEGKTKKTKSDFQSSYKKFGYVDEERWRKEIENL